MQKGRGKPELMPFPIKLKNVCTHFLRNNGLKESEIFMVDEPLLRGYQNCEKVNLTKMWLKSFLPPVVYLSIIDKVFLRFFVN